MINRRSAWLLYLLTVFIAAWLLIDEPGDHGFVATGEPAPASTQTPVIQTEFMSGGLTNEVHSATAVELANGDIGVFWYAGTREGGSDVAIYSRFLHKSKDRSQISSWSEIHQVVDRTGSTKGLNRHIRKLGNPLALYHQERLWLFYVTVSVGGWGGSSINLVQSKDNGKTWGRPRRLVTSPFINLSTLVKERAIVLDDSSILLPVYHEFIGKFSELLHLDPDGEVIEKYRVSHGSGAIQPVAVPLSKKSAVVFMRNTTEDQSSSILSSLCNDGGSDCQALHSLELPNPNSAVTGVSLDNPGELLLVFNNDKKQRNDLTLAYTADYQVGKSGQWKILYEFESEAGEKADGEILHNPYSYPFLVKTSTGDFHLFYSWRKKYIKHVFFNRAALNEMLIGKPLPEHKPNMAAH